MDAAINHSAGAPPPASPPLPPSPPPWRNAARALVTPAAPPLWRHFWWVIGAGLLLRLLAAWHGHWFVHIDEIYQYLEQAHRVVFGYGAIPWEYRYGARAWLVPGMAMPPLFLAKWLGVEHPWAYATMVQSWNALLSLSIPIATYLTARRVLGEPAARWALVFATFWYEFIVLSPRTMSEIYATYFLMAGLAAGAGTRRMRWVFAGFLLGGALAIRIPYASLVGVIGLLWLWQLPRRLSFAAIAGGIAALLLWGAIDRLSIGGWWASLGNYFKYISLLPTVPTVSEAPGIRLLHFESLLAASFGLYPLLFLLSLPLARRLWLFMLPVALLLGLHLMQTINVEYRTLFALLPFFWLMAGEATAFIFRKSRRWGAGWLGVILLVSLAGAAGKLPNLKTPYYHTFFFEPFPLIHISHEVHDLMAEEEKKGNTVLVWRMDWLLDFGGYYRLHRNIPVLQQSKDFTRDHRHQQLWARDIPLHDIATHVVAPAGEFNDPAFEAIPLSHGLRLHINKTPPKPPPLPPPPEWEWEWVYDYVHPGAPVLPPIPLTPYNPAL